MKLLVIGAGNMGLTYAKSINDSNILGDNGIYILENSADKRTELESSTPFKVFDKASDCIDLVDIILLAVKPQNTKDLFPALRPNIKNNQLIISVMAGVKINTIQDGLGTNKVIRCMPNLPAQIGLGMTTFTCSSEVTSIESDQVKSLLSTTGKAISVATENDIDKSTGISGSGPAYIFYFLESLIEAGIDMGFDEETAKTLATQTFDGAIKLYQSSELSTTEWMDRVASKGGTTRAGLDSLANNDVKNKIKECANAAYNRAVELGNDTL